MPQYQVVLQLGAAQVKIAVLEADVLVDVAVLIQHEWERLGAVEQLALQHLNFHLAGFHGGVDGSGRPGDDHPSDSQHELAADGLGNFMGGFVHLRVKDDLGDPLPVTKVNENKPSMIAAAQGPPHQNDLLANVSGIQMTAVM